MGCLLEMNKAGKENIILHDGEVRTFLEDGDIVVIKGHAEKNG